MTKMQNIGYFEKDPADEFVNNSLRCIFRLNNINLKDFLLFYKKSLLCCREMVLP